MEQRLPACSWKEPALPLLWSQILTLQSETQYVLLFGPLCYGNYVAAHSVGCQGALEAQQGQKTQGAMHGSPV